MNKIRQTSVTVGGKKGIIVHNLLCADGPIDPETGEPLIDPETGDVYPGANDDMAALMQKYCVKLRGPGRGGPDNAHTVPRFGVLSLLARKTPIFVYDHPSLKQLSNTAFTDGINVFVDADFMRKCVREELDSNGQKVGVLFVLLHELMHKLRQHVFRMKKFPPIIANIASDQVINGSIKQAFPFKVIDLLEESLHGMKDAEVKKFSTMSEEIVTQNLYNQWRKQKRKKGNPNPEPKDGDANGNNAGSAPGSKAPPRGPKKPKDDYDEDNVLEDDDDNTNGQGGPSEQFSNGGEEDMEDDGEFSSVHTIQPEDLVKIFKEEGLYDSMKDALNLPEDTEKSMEEYKKKSQLDCQSSIQNALAEARQLGSGYPGSHIAESASEVITGLQKGKLNYLFELKKMIAGGRRKQKHSDDEIDLPHILGDYAFGRGIKSWWQGGQVNIKNNDCAVGIIDSSGSTSAGNMRQIFMSEAIHMQSTMKGDSMAKLLLYSADTVVRGEPLMITKNNAHQLLDNGIPLFGNGGTDFTAPLKTILQEKEVLKHDVKYVFYWTDCEAPTPKQADFQEYLDRGIKFVFFTTPGKYSESWAREMPWAKVVVIEDGGVADLRHQPKAAMA